MNMSKFYEVSKVLDKRTDAHGRVQCPSAGVAMERTPIAGWTKPTQTSA